MHRRWCAAVALVAVVTMHGLQCGTHDLHEPSGHGVAMTLLSLPPTTGEAGPPATAEHAEHAATPVRAADDSSSYLSLDLGAVCLAVLAAIAALLGMVLSRGRPAHRGPPSWVSVRRWISTPALPRPPELFVLCVLRN